MARVWRICTIAAWALCVVGAIAIAEGSIAWETELGLPIDGTSLAPEGFMRFSGGYSWEEGYGASGVILLPLPTGEGRLDVAAHIGDDVMIDWPIGTWTLDGSASFSVQTPSLDAFSTTANVTAYGLSTTVALDLYSFQGAPATALMLEVSGPMQAGWGLSIAGSFGDSWGTPCNFDFTGVTVGFEAFPWCCVHTNMQAFFSCAGYERTTIDIDIELWDGVLVLDGALEFALETKSLSLTPYLTVGQQCIWLSVGIEPQEIGPGTMSSVDRFVIQGIGIETCEIGSVTFSAISALGGGLYRNANAMEIDLHANGYYVALAPNANPKMWTQTDYDTVISIQYEVATFVGGYTSSQLAVDAYFGTKASMLFDLALITATWTHGPSEAFSYRIALQFDPAGTDHRIEFGFDVSKPLL